MKGFYQPRGFHSPEPKKSTKRLARRSTANQLARDAPGRLLTPCPLPENLPLGLHRKLLLCAPCEHNLQAPLFSGTWSARTRPEPTQGSWVGLIFQGDIQGISGSICESISGAAPSSLLPTGQENILAMTDSRSGRRSFDSKLISLLPLDEAPVHVHRFAARVPLRFERLRVPVWNPYSRDRLGPAKSEDRKGGEGNRRQSHKFFLALLRSRLPAGRIRACNR